LPTGFVHWTAPTEAGYFIGMLRDLDPTLIVAVGVMLGTPLRTKAANELKAAD
jgi:hypothetical protein